MSSYVKATNFATKDTLPTGDSNKIVKGTEIDNEFNAIAGAISSKADLASPSLTGTPSAPTAAFGTNTTQLATTAFVTAALQAVYPVGSIYINAASTSNPAVLMGFGTWVEFGAGKVLIGLDAADTDFDALEETGGTKTGTAVGTIAGTVGDTALTEAQMPKHYHQMVGPHSTTIVQGSSSSWYNYGGGTPDDGAVAYATWSTGGDASSGEQSTGTSNGDVHTHEFTGTFTGAEQYLLPPYIIVKMWKRTA